MLKNQNKSKNYFDIEVVKFHETEWDSKFQFTVHIKGSKLPRPIDGCHQPSLTGKIFANVCSRL